MCARLQAVCLVCSFYHEVSHLLIKERRPVRCIAEMLVCLGVRGTLHRLLRSADMGIMSHACHCSVSCVCCAVLSDTKVGEVNKP